VPSFDFSPLRTISVASIFARSYEKTLHASCPS
jgi:hypothetical protein